MLFVSHVDLGLVESLRDQEYRARFFRLAAQETIASQIRLLRELRDMRQVDLAGAAGMKQSAISRLEKADYSSWNFTTLLRLADALDARVRVTFEPSEDVIRDLEGGSSAADLPNRDFGQLTTFNAPNDRDDPGRSREQGQISGGTNQGPIAA